MQSIGELIDASQLKDKTLIAKKLVKVYRSAADNAIPFGTVAAGDPVGVVFSWVDPNYTSRSTLYWMFYDAQNGAYYVPHEAGAFDVTSLKEQGVLTVSDQVAKEQKEQDKLNLSPLEYYIKYYGKYVGYFLIAAVGVKAAIPAIAQGFKK